MITLTETREITPYLWVHPDDDDQHQSRRAAVNGWNAFPFIATSVACGRRH
jgi:hypothetical protein